MAKFSIATNFDLNFLKEIERLNRKYSPSEIIEVYGSMPVSLVGSGRSYVGLPKISARDLADHIKHAHNFGLEFNYLMNAPKYRNFQDAAWKKQVYQFISYLKNIEVDSITIADESLVKYVRKNFPNIPVHVSLVAGIDSPKEAKSFSDLGVNSITLNQHTTNRNINKIKEIINIVDCPIKLYANVSCLQDCPMRDEHYAWLGSLSKEVSSNIKPGADHFILWCENKYMENPIELLRSPFIRPEGLGLYEQIGVDFFKLSDRREPTNALVKLLEAYMSRIYHGNLFSLLFRDDRKWTNAVKNIIDEKSLGDTAIYIDNDKLTELNFDQKVITLKADNLKTFYKMATNKAVKGISDQKTKNFHVKLHSIGK